MKKRKLVIFLADLTHTGRGIATENIPLNIGLIASYALRKFANDIQIKLFKYPDKLISALQNQKFDVLACSTYIWNNNLSEWAFGLAKELNSKTVTVRGGWNFPLEEEQQKEYLSKYRNTDIFCLGEGEETFSNVIERLLKIDTLAQWSRYPINGCVFLNKEDGSLVKGEAVPRIKDLSSIPSPYTAGLLDDFFDGKLLPLLETARGCPFTCNYCNNSDDYYKKVVFFPVEYVVDEINYIAKKLSNSTVRYLLIADTNFGMFPRDKEIAVALRNTQKKYKWPLGIGASTGKNKVDSIINICSILDNALTISMSVQSLNPGTLKAIKRDNIGVKMYKDLSRKLYEKKLPQFAELIVPLPLETYDSFADNVDKLIKLGAKRIITHTLELNYGTIYKNEEFRKEFGYSGKFRLVPNDFGIYEGEKVFDCEEVASFTNTMSFEQYLLVRKFALLMELVFSNQIFNEVFMFLKENGVSEIDFIKYILEDSRNCPANIKAVFDSFISDTTTELKSTEAELIEFYSDEKNYARLKASEIGGNVIFKHKGMMLSRFIGEWVEYVLDCANRILKIDKKDLGANEMGFQLAAISAFTNAKLDSLFVIRNSEDSINLDLKYDILSWLSSDNGHHLKEFSASGSPFRYRFYFDNNQMEARRDLFSRYGSDISGISKILARVTALGRMFRTVEKI